MKNGTFLKILIGLLITLLLGSFAYTFAIDQKKVDRSEVAMALEFMKTQLVDIKASQQKIIDLHTTNNTNDKEKEKVKKK